MVLEFDKNSVKKVEDDFKNLKLEGAQFQIVDQMGEFVSKFLPLNKLATKGFMWRTAKEWQTRHKMNIADLAHMDAQERVKSSLEMLGILKEQLNTVLKDKTQEGVLSELMDKTLSYYKEHFASK